jgi:hypothetical protein
MFLKPSDYYAEIYGTYGAKGDGKMENRKVVIVGAGVGGLLAFSERL